MGFFAILQHFRTLCRIAVAFFPKNERERSVVNMTVIYHFFQFLGAHAAGTIFLLIDLLIALGLVALWIHAVAQRRRQIADLRDERRFYEAAANCSPLALIAIRRSDEYPVYAAGDLKELTGATLEQFRQNANLLFDKVPPAENRRIRRTIQEWDGTHPLRMSFQANKSGRWLELTLEQSQDGAYLLSVLRDCTEEHEQIVRLQEQLRQAESESRSKTTFLSRMSHEIRTPINGQLGMLALAKTRLNDPAAAMGYLDKAEDLSQHLLSIINDVLDMSRIEADKIELEAKPFDLAALGGQLRNMFQKTVEAKGVRFDLRFEHFESTYVVGDQLRLSQVLVNLLSNAVKFTSEGEITVLFRQMLRHNDQLDLLIRVHDTGIGMEPSFLSHIFRPFEQESIETAHKYGGSGLGMAITDQLVRLMGGKIYVESQPGRGSTFSVYLHLPVAAEVDHNGRTAVREVADFSMQGMRALMAEDNMINSEIAASVLGEQYGVTVETVENGKLAVERFASKPEGYYDFILMDIQMPVMDGRTAAAAIRALERPDAKRVLIFALSADAFVEDERMSVEAGMNDHFSKPIDFDKMRRQIGWYVSQKGSKQ